MYYKVVDEKCYNGTKSKFSKGQTIKSNDIDDVKKSFENDYYNIYEDRLNLKLEFYNFGIFNDKKNLYKLFLNKIK
jgi:hypothetical protein